MFATMAKWIHPRAQVSRDEGSAPSAAIPAGAAAPSAAPLEPMSLPGIDTRSGLATALNNETLYRRLLLKFRESQADFAGQFAKARAGTDLTAAMRHAHTLRGTAATVGAKGVAEAAGRLEQACKQNASAADIEELVRAVTIELAPVIEGLDAIVEAAATKASAQPVQVDAKELSAARTELMALLHRGDAAALELCKLHEGMLRAGLPAHWKQISDSVQAFDFEAALTLLKQTIQEDQA
jgi:HPt (histidine-containing phosphotransfer) domain-containing protein